MTLTDWELDDIRKAIAETLPDVCSILTLTTVSDNMGELTQTWTETDQAKCRLDAEVAGEGLAGAGLQPYERYTLTLPQGTTITTANRVKVGSTTYNIVAINLSPSWRASMRVKLQPVLP
jgi:head-tail adaptor